MTMNPGTKHISVRYVVERWTESKGTATEPAGMSRAVLEKSYEGELTGTGVGEILIFSATRGGKTILGHGQNLAAGYVGQEIIRGRLGEREGSFVVQHGGTQDGHEPAMFGRIVPGSGQGELIGIRGTWVLPHKNPTAPTVELEYYFVDERD